MCVCVPLYFYVRASQDAHTQCSHACLVQSGAFLLCNTLACVRRGAAECVYVCALEQENVILNVSHKSSSQLL